MPENAIYVGRPSKWGNPYPIDANTTRAQSLKLYLNYVIAKRKEDSHWLDELRGKDLACWCPLNKPCHADILIACLDSEKLEWGEALPL
ncbi:MAG: DUF4326 domain-containing protein [Nitrososphaerales archaeon]